TYSPRGNIFEVNIRGTRSVPELSLKNIGPGSLIRQRHVDQRVQTTWATKRSIQLRIVSEIILYKRAIAKFTCSGRLVAPMTKTFFFTPIPSNSVNNIFTTLSLAPPASPIDPPRLLAIESNSSRNTTQGAAARA